ncbi:MAG: hypothetical protein OSP8Acid_06600 [uncultured Acidilobus sp. OSP8]|nr:MAG: hypothetical protein OSP8Acid_06600 [uncultured Acidilobus sp. OSP8]
MAPVLSIVIVRGPNSSTSKTHMASAMPSLSSQWTALTDFMASAASAPAPPVKTA